MLFRSNRVREVQSSTDDISTFAGDGKTLASIGDKGPAVDGELFRPAGEAEDAQGDVYIADAGNNRIQEIAATDSPYSSATRACAGAMQNARRWCSNLFLRWPGLRRRGLRLMPSRRPRA